MHRSLVIDDAAASLALLTPAELRAAANLEVGYYDEMLSAIGLQVAASICSECNVAIGQGAQPTLLQETLIETFRSVSTTALYLSRRHEIEIASVVVDDETIDAADYIVDPESGLLTRLCDDIPSRWYGSKIVVAYDAGFATVPNDLKQAASDFVRLMYNDRSRNPSVKSSEKDIPGVMRERYEHWVGSLPGSGEGAVPDVVAGQLKRFRNAAVG